PLSLDIVPVSLSYDTNTLMATLGYNVNSPAMVRSFQINFLIDSNSNGVLDDPGDALVGTTIVSGGPGAATTGQSYAGSPPALGQRIFAVVDASDLVEESSEGAANQISTASAGVLDDDDITLLNVGTETSGDPVNVFINYDISALAAGLPPFDVQIGLDKGNNGTFDALLAQFRVNDPNALLEGGHVAAAIDVRTELDLLAPNLKLDNGDSIRAIADSGGEIAESDELNNALSGDALSVDIVPASLTLDALQQATLTYDVESPAMTHNFEIEFYLDSNTNNVLDVGDALVHSTLVMGNPGSDTATADFSGSPAASGQRIFAVVDAGDLVAEANEGPANEISTANPALTDLIAVS
ncbi:MAG: hypothetical protein V3T70_01750, partial [Phycisphaerae bacterium]